VVVAAERVHPVQGSSLTDEELATLPTAYGTALGMIERGGVQAGETVLVTGASGGVGLPWYSSRTRAARASSRSPAPERSPPYEKQAPTRRSTAAGTSGPKSRSSPPGVWTPRSTWSRAT